MTDLIGKIHDWASRKLRDRELRRWGQTRQCPWCRQMVETNGEHLMRKSEHCELFDTFTCGVCGGESHWEFGPVPFPRGLGEPPNPSTWAVDADREARRLLDQIRGEAQQ